MRSAIQRMTSGVSSAVSRSTRSISLCGLCLVGSVLAGEGVAQDTAVAPGLAYGIEFTLVEDATLPALQSFAVACNPSGKWLVVGGREQGLHGFASKVTAGNFKAFNKSLYVIDPESGEAKGLDLEGLPADLRDPLRVTNAQQFYDLGSDTLFLVGGYGVDSQHKQHRKTTFGTLTAFNVSEMIRAVEAGDLGVARGLIRQSRDPRLAVTGGGLERIGSRFFLVFGQHFDGEFVFDADHLPYVQSYTEALRAFTVDESTMKIEVFGQVTSSALDRPFHRRDLNVLPDIDPLTGKSGIAVFGGVFRPGALLGYPEPIIIDQTNTVTVERSFQQKSNHYECVVIPVYSEASGTISRTFVGGITSEVITAEQAGRMNPKGPSDGLPWVNTMSRIAHSPGATEPYIEYELGATPGGRYIGADGHFIPAAGAREAGVIDERGIIHLDQIDHGDRILVGHMYGGIESKAPQGPTSPTNSLFEVHVNYRPIQAKKAQ